MLPAERRNKGIATKALRRKEEIWLINWGIANLGIEELNSQIMNFKKNYIISLVSLWLNYHEISFN